MSYLDAVILGIVEGITEFLPISSTGHLILTARLLHLEQTEFLKMFEVVVQLGAIFSVFVLYAKRVLFDIALIKRLVIAILPSLIVGGLLYSFIKKLFEFEALSAWMLLLGGIFIIGIEWWRKESPSADTDMSHIPLRTAFFIGMFQLLSFIPGVSRAGATILGGLLLGMKRTVIIEFSFLLAVPTMLAASALDIYKTGSAVDASEWGILGVGMLTSFIVALLVMRWLLKFVETHTFLPFGVYRILAGIAFLVLVL